MAMSFAIETDTLTPLLAQLADRLPEALAIALYREAQGIMADAKAQTPVNTGVLRDSGQVADPEIDHGDVSVTLGFGGAASAYAVVQHEDLQFNHTVGNAKFLERPALEHAASAPERLADTLTSLL